MTKKKRVVVFTTTKEYEHIDYKDVWDEIIKERLEEKYGRMKEKNITILKKKSMVKLNPNI